jgi:hypothetical protein
VALAALSAGGAAIHVAVAPDHFHEYALFGVFFLAASAAQAAWAIAVLVRPNRPLLVAAVIGNAGLIMLWALSRTVGLPVGPELWRPEGITAADALATQLEVVLVVGCAWAVRQSMIGLAWTKVQRWPSRSSANMLVRPTTTT